MRLEKARSAGRSRGDRAVLAAASFAVLLLAAAPASAQRDDPALQLGCANDFFRLCAGVDPASSEADRCMNRNRPRLSPDCRNAIGDYETRTKTKVGPRD